RLMSPSLCPVKIKVLDPTGSQFLQQVTYQWKPNFCPKCQTFRHICPTIQPGAYKPMMSRKRRETQKATQEWRITGVIETTVNKLNLQIGNTGLDTHAQ
ncbi:hypothetical protein HAX54_041901, partial [Datura stramonium]|nr:hypothetical protein [Datura stramonium]